jgi:hypothetical protein
MDGKTQYAKMAMLVKLIYRLYVIPTKLQFFFAEWISNHKFLNCVLRDPK